MAAMSGCTQNNGRIGHWFGQWKVERMTVDGEDYADYPGNAFFCFQSSVFGVRISRPELEGSGMYYGIWEEQDGGRIRVRFNTDESEVPPASACLHLEEECVFSVLSADGKRKTLQRVADDGRTYTYYLRSW